MSLPFTLGDMLAPAQALVAEYRTRMGLPQLTGPDGVGSGTIAFGAEYLDFHLSPPGIIIVPRDEDIQNAIDSGVTDGPAPYLPKRYWLGALRFDAWCWGDEDPDFDTTQNTAYSFDSALELRRELCVALAQIGGIAGVGTLRGRWEQPANVKRLGRLYVLTFQFWTPINDLTIRDTTVVPFATPSTPGATIDATVAATSPDGTTTIQEGVIVAPAAPFLI